MFILISTLLVALLVACGGEKSPAKLTVSEAPATTKVVVGEEPNFAGGKLTVEYEDGTTKEISMTEVAYSGLNNEKLGQQTVALIYTEGGKTVSTTVDLTVVSSKVVSIKLQTDGVKKDYFDGERFDKTGLVVIATNQKGEESTVGAYEIAPLTMTAGVSEVVVSYRDLSASIPVTVLPRAILSAVITGEPTKKEYFIGESFLSAGTVMTVTNNDDTVEVFSADQLRYYHGTSGMAYSGPWTKEDCVVRVVADALYGSAEATIRITVKEVLPEKVTLLSPAGGEDALIFAAGDAFDFYDPDLISVKIEYNNGDELIVEGSTDYFDYNTDTPISAEDTFVTIHCLDNPDLTLNIPIVIAESIAVSVPPTKTTYTFEDNVDLSGLELLVTLVSGDTRVVAYGDASRIYPDIRSVNGPIEEITVRYLGCYASFPVTYSDALLDPEPTPESGDEE